MNTEVQTPPCNRATEPEPALRTSAPGETKEGHIASQLRQVHCTLHARLSQYDPNRFNLLVNESQVPLRYCGVPLEREIPFLSSLWSVNLDAAPVRGDAGAADCVVTFRCKSGGVSAIGVSADLQFGDWAKDNYVLLPGAAYNGNRFLSRRIPYSPKLYFVQDIGPDKPIIISDVPRLNFADGPSRIQERSGSLSVPAMGFRSATLQLGFLLLTDQGNGLGDYGLSIEETRSRDAATFSITAPLVRELYNYRICDLAGPSLDRPADFKAGDEVRIGFRLHIFPAPSVQSLFDKFVEVRKTFKAASAVRGRSADSPTCHTAGVRVGSASPVGRAAGLKTRDTADLEACATAADRQLLNCPSTLPFSACFALQEAKFNRENFVPEHGYYSVGPRTNFLQDWQIGWTGGMISTYPLLFAGGEPTRRNVIRNFDWLFPNGISPSGFFWDCGANGAQWIGGDIRKPHTGNWHLIRKSGDGVFYILKQFALMERLGIAVKPAWRDGVRRVCDALATLWRKHGQFGQFVDSLTGEICVGGSTGGAIIPAALALAADYFKQPGYLEVATQAGEKFYTAFTSSGLSCGGPGDALQNPDSESWYGLLESYAQLFDATGERRWLDRAGEASRQFATWVVAYDYQFPPQSTFAKAGIRTTGAVYANTQNKHAAPGICTYSGLGLLKLFRATGDRFHLELLHDIAHNLPQYLPHPLRPLGDATFGRMCERVNMTDWEGPERIGETLNLSTWAETSLMLTTVEIPGLYVQPDKSLLVAFDNIAAQIVFDTPQELTLRLSNPTLAPARVTILAESNAEALRSLPQHALFGSRTAELEPGGTATLAFPKSHLYERTA